MSIKVQDFLNVNIVFNGVELLDTLACVKKFERFIGSEIVVIEGATVSANLSGSMSAKARTFTIQKDRIRVDCSQINSVIQRDYPSLEDLARLAEVVNCAISNSTQIKKPTNFGFNLDLVYSQDSGLSASKYIARQILSPVLLEKKEWDIVSGFGGFTLDEDGKRWSIKIEPRYSDIMTPKVFLSLNLHFNESRFPEKNEIHSSLDEMWRKALIFGNWINDNVANA